MSALAFPSGRAAPDTSRTLRLLAAALVVGYAASLGWAALNGQWLYDAAGRPIPSDFINFWAAGKMALEGRAADVFDWELEKQVQIAAAGAPFDGYFSWLYPPTLLFACAPLALIAYPAAHLVWLAATAPLYAAAIRAILPRPGVVVAALAFPPALWNAGCGQNGFLTAALLGGALVNLERRPLLAGTLLGLLTFKPQFGVLIPLALVASGHWRAIAAAAGTACALALASLAAFGLAPWIAFLNGFGLVNRVILVEGGVGFAELLSLFGFIRWLGGGVAAAWTGQIALVALLAATVWRGWRGPAPFGAKSALLASACLLATPYVYVYDLVALAVAIAFLVREGLGERERIALLVAAATPLIGPMAGLPLGLLAAPAVFAIAAARTRMRPPRASEASGADEGRSGQERSARVDQAG